VFKNKFALVCLITLVCFNSSLSAADTWTGFRGDGSNISPAANLPLKWSPENGIRWKQTVPGYGQSSPVVWKNLVFVTSIEGPQQETCLLHTYDLTSGKLIWKKEIKASQTKKTSSMVSRAAPTPAVDENGIYAFFESGDVVAYTHAGAPLWHRSLVKDYGPFVSNHGIGNSLAQTADNLIVLTAHDGPSYLLALNKKTGETTWKTDREAGVAWTSPVIADRAGTPEIIVSSRGTVDSYQGLTGELLWTHSGISGNTIPSASVLGNYVLIGASTDRRNPDAENASASNCCLKLVTKEGKPGYEVLWKAEKAISYYCTPLAYQGCAYFVNKVGVVYCLDLETGKQHFAQRLSGPCWSSPLGAGEQVYFFTKKGQTDVIRQGPQFELLATNELFSDSEEKPTAPAEKPAENNAEQKSAKSSTSKQDEKPASENAGEQSRSTAGYPQLGQTVYGSAAVDQAVLVRTGTELYCLEKQK
tara:strand:- start:175599 stop:177020 length:1422 start_codon:yes stop_codon:yes gene_type:complete